MHALSETLNKFKCWQDKTEQKQVYSKSFWKYVLAEKIDDCYILTVHVTTNLLQTFNITDIIEIFQRGMPKLF